MSKNPHDAFFKAVFSRPEVVSGELASVLPPALVAQLDLNTLHLESEHFVDPRLSERQSDLLYTVQLAGREVLLYVLFEHQSTVDRLMAMRLLIYMGRIWDRWLRDHSDAERVPAIIPLVLYQGPSRWSAATQFCDLIDLPADLLGAAREHLPSFRFLLDDLSGEADEALRRRPLTDLGALALLLFRHARDEQQALVAFLRSVADLLNTLPNRDDNVLVFSYILEVAQDASDEITEALTGDLSPTTLEAAVTAADQLREQGRLEGERRILLRQLRKVIGTIPVAVEQRVANASESELEAWADRVLGATTLDEVFATDAE